MEEKLRNSTEPEIESYDTSSLEQPDNMPISFYSSLDNDTVVPTNLPVKTETPDEMVGLPLETDVTQPPQGAAGAVSPEYPEAQPSVKKKFFGAFDKKHNSTGVIKQRKRAILVSVAIILALILLTAGLTLLLGSQRLKQSSEVSNGQDIDIKGAKKPSTFSEVTGADRSMLVNGDIISRGMFKLSNGKFTTTLRVVSSPQGSMNNTISLPSSNGVVCLDTNNCEFASISSIFGSQGLATTLQNQVNNVVGSLNGQRGTLTIQGSDNQIIVSADDGVIRLSTAQDLGVGSTPTFSGLKVNNNVSIAGNVQLGVVESGVWKGSTIDVPHGGTGLSSYTPGSIIYASGPTTIATLASGVSGSCLTSNGSSPVWSACLDLTSVVQGGNSFGSVMTVGTNDNFNLNIRTNGTDRFSIASDSATLIGQGDTTLSSLGSLNLGAATSININQNTTVNGNFNVQDTFSVDTSGKIIHVGNSDSNAPSRVTIPGGRWMAVGSSADVTKLVIVSEDGYIYTSSDSGATWTQQTSAGQHMTMSIASSSDGTKLAFSDLNDGYIYTSSDSGATWTQRTSAGQHMAYGIASSSDGTKLAFSDLNDGYIYTSIDSGATWTQQTSAGQHIAGSIGGSSDGTKLALNDINDGYIYTSTDSGATWTQQVSAGQHGAYGIASSSDGTKLALSDVNDGYIYTSSDSGVTWTQQVSAGQHWAYGIASSSDGTKLALSDVNDGYIYTSSDSGVTWTQQTSAGQHVSYGFNAIKVTNSNIFTATNDGYILTTSNFGLTWNIDNQTGPGIRMNGEDAVFSADSMKISVLGDSQLYVSTDSGATWTTKNLPSNGYRFRSIASNADGTKLAIAGGAGNGGGYIYTSSDSGATWTQQTSAGSRDWYDIASSSDGTNIVAVTTAGWGGEGYIFTSTDSGTTWTQRTFDSNDSWRSVTSSADGTKLVAINNGYIYTSIDSGATWTQQTSAGIRSWQSITSSTDGTKLAAAVSGGYIYTSTDSGITWTQQSSAGIRSWRSITSSTDGTKLAALDNDGNLYTSIDFGNGWSQGTSVGSYGGWVISSPNGDRLMFSTDGVGIISLNKEINLVVDANTTFKGEISFGPTSSIRSDTSLNLNAADKIRLNQDTVVTGDLEVKDSSLVLDKSDLKTNGETRLTSQGGLTNITSYLQTTGNFEIQGLVSVDNENNSVTLGNDGYRHKSIKIKMSTNYIATIASSSSGNKIIAGSKGDSSGYGYIYTSSDYGKTWVERTGAGLRSWSLVTSSSDGTKLIAVPSGGYIYTSVDSGATWTEQTSIGWRNWDSITTSADGTKLAIIDGYSIYTSTDSGATWTTKNLPSNGYRFRSIASNADGTKLAIAGGAGNGGGYIYTSSDSGATWTQQTSAGSRDWYDIASSSDGTNIVAVTTAGWGGEGYIFTSTDSGATWTQRTFDSSDRWESVTSSADGTKLVASNGYYIYISTDSGATWTHPPSADSNSWSSIIFSTDGTKLVGTSESGYIYISTDFGVTWTESSKLPMGNTFIKWGSVLSDDGTKLVVSSGGGLVYSSRDSGASWARLPWNSYVDGRGSISSSPDGTKLAIIDGYSIYTSTDSGATWTSKYLPSSSYRFKSLASNADGTKLAIAGGAGNGGGYIYTSSDSGATWTQQTSAGLRDWSSLASSSDGTKLVAGSTNSWGNGGYIFTSTDSGATWTQRTFDSSDSWESVTSSADGTKLVAKPTGSYIHISTDSGATWTRQTPYNLLASAASLNGTKLIARADGGYIYTSTDSGATWTWCISLGQRNWSSITSSADGTKLAAVAYNSYVYISTDSGITWTEQTATGLRNWNSVYISGDGTKLVLVDENGGLTVVNMTNKATLDVVADSSFYGNLTVMSGGTINADGQLNIGAGSTTSIRLNNDVEVTGSFTLATHAWNRNSETSTAGYANATSASSYVISSSSGTTNTSFTTTMDLTGLGTTPGKVVYLTVKSIKGATPAPQTHTTNLLIGGTSIASVATATGTSASTIQRSFIVMYIDGAWRVMGTGLSAAPASNVSTVNTADYAEWISYTGEKPQAGDLLSVGDNNISAKKSDISQDPYLIGVVSSEPFMVGSADDGHSVVLALTGRVPVRVNTSNGNIKKGDLITSSGVAGQGMKATLAGKVVGVALEDYDGTQPDNLVTVQLRVGYDIPEPNPGEIGASHGLQGSTISLTGDASIDGNMMIGGVLNVSGATNLASLTVSGDAVILGSLKVVGEVEVESLKINSHIITAGGTPSVQLGVGAGAANPSADIPAPVITVEGNDISGTITITTGDNTSESEMAKLIFSKVFKSKPRVLLTSANKDSANVGVYYSEIDPPEAGFSIMTSNQPGKNTTYKFTYLVVQ